MPLRCSRSPVIILGSGRCGTTLVAKQLDRVGLFLGKQLQRDHEALYFLGVNDRMMRRVNGAWDHPAPFRDFLNCPGAVKLTLPCLEADLRSRRVVSFLGWGGYLRHRSVERLPFAWGWKDPRTVFTLPLWLELFPTAKIVYVVRNGVDVAASLRTRELKLLDRRTNNFDRHFRFGWGSRLERAGYKGSARCLTMDGAFSLWGEYVAQMERHLARIPNERFVLKFEDFLKEPAGRLGELARFCGLNASDTAIAAAAGGVRPERANAYSQNAELSRFYDSVRSDPWMARYGYAPAPVEPRRAA